MNGNRYAQNLKCAIKIVKQKSREKKIRNCTGPNVDRAKNKNDRKIDNNWHSIRTRLSQINQFN